MNQTIQYSFADLEKAGKEVNSRYLSMARSMLMPKPEYDKCVKEYKVAVREYRKIKKALTQLRLKPTESKYNYTLVDLEKERQWDGGGDGPNNPRAFSRALRAHNQRLCEIEAYLKNQGVDTSPENRK